MSSEPSLEERLRTLVEGVPSPFGEVRRAASGWRAVMHDEVIALEVEMDPREGVFVLIGSVGSDGKPEPGPYRDDQGRLVRMHASKLLSRQSPSMSELVRGVLSDWPFPDIAHGDWGAMAELCNQVWAHIAGRRMMTDFGWTEA